jgi:class 3 adenylate cyclase/CheY-like chemotaxis protein/tRNA A-37 threonylcarbamoyl transferase component Bud32
VNARAQQAGSRILAIDDDPGMLSLVSLILERAGYEVEVAAEGAQGLDRIRARTPDLVLCDVQMPVMDGFTTLQAVRADAATATLPFVLLTSLDDRDNVRRGMRLGADDFLSKPVRADELVESVSGALDKRRRMSALVSGHALPRQDELRALYERELGLSPRTPAAEAALAGVTGRKVTQTVLFSDIRGFTTISERLPVTEIAELLSRYLREVCKPILQEGGRIMKIMGDGLMASFGHEAPEDTRAHAASGLRAGLRILEVAQDFRQWVESRFDFSGLPPFDVGVGVHTGPVMLFQLSAGGVGDLTIVGDTVNVAARLETKSKELGWPMVASMATIEAAGPRYSVAETREIELAGREARIVVGRLASLVTTSPRPISQQQLSAGIRAVLDENARSTAEAAKEAIDSTLHSIDAQLERPAAQREPVIRGYRVLAKIGEGGMSTVYLAEEEANRRKAVLKVLKGRRGDDDALWKRFFQECAILSNIDHEHVVRIYDQGFGDELAYIAMEHLGGGSLREVMDRGLSARQALSLLSQAASALAEIHRCGIVHRDIKPANLLLREASVLVLTDFGVAKRLDQGAGQTIHGEVLGTPYYISPEQAQGGEITPQTDLYSLGIIFYEMLTGARPFGGATILEILAQHTMAPIPRLQPELAGYQPLIDGMLAKRPADRFASAEAVLDAIDLVWTQTALKKSALA